MNTKIYIMQSRRYDNGQYWFESEERCDKAVEHMNQGTEGYDKFVLEFSDDVPLVWGCEYGIAKPKREWGIKPHSRIFDAYVVKYFPVLYTSEDYADGDGKLWDITKGWCEGAHAAYGYGNTREEAFVRAKKAYEEDNPDAPHGIYQLDEQSLKALRLREDRYAGR